MAGGREGTQRHSTSGQYGWRLCSRSALQREAGMLSCPAIHTQAVADEDLHRLVSVGAEAYGAALAASFHVDSDAM